MGDRKQISEYLTNDTIRTYYALDKSMMKAHVEDRNEDAEATARTLLENLDLPILLRARACMILGCGESPDFLDMAKESVRVAELGLSLCEEPGDLEKNLVEDCKKGLEEAQAAADEKAKEDEDEDEEDEEGMKLVWRAGQDEEDEKDEQGGGEGKGQANSGKQSMGQKKSD